MTCHIVILPLFAYKIKVFIVDWKAQLGLIVFVILQCRFKIKIILILSDTEGFALYIVVFVQVITTCTSVFAFKRLTRYVQLFEIL